MTPVSSRMCSGSSQAGRAAELTCADSSGFSLMRPASRIASRPAPTASAYVVSRVSTIAALTPNSFAKSKLQTREASWITWRAWLIGCLSRAPLAFLWICTTFRSSCAWIAAGGSLPIKFFPSIRASTLPGPNTGAPVSPLGSPRETPVTTMSPRWSPRSRTRCASATIDASVSGVGNTSPVSSFRCPSGGAVASVQEGGLLASAPLDCGVVCDMPLALGSAGLGWDHVTGTLKRIMRTSYLTSK
mmetsp:Transcript_28049/g.67962  ORF Transcript_28049/g.67962 Transcript_28049/m.67962 type:complete len:245 (-) Transcript_28049:242-976(-)